jgi:hypothetical protein
VGACDVQDNRGTAENKHRTTHCEAVKERSIPRTLPIRAQHGRPAFWLVHVMQADVMAGGRWMYAKRVSGGGPGASSFSNSRCDRRSCIRTREVNLKLNSSS